VVSLFFSFKVWLIPEEWIQGLNLRLLLIHSLILEDYMHDDHEGVQRLIN